MYQAKFTADDTGFPWTRSHAALGLAGSLLKVLPEVVGTVYLEAGPSRG